MNERKENTMMVGLLAFVGILCFVFSLFCYFIPWVNQMNEKQKEEKIIGECLHNIFKEIDYEGTPSYSYTYNVADNSKYKFVAIINLYIWQPLDQYSGWCCSWQKKTNEMQVDLLYTIEFGGNL